MAGYAQISVSPATPTDNDTVTITFDATKGNGALTGVLPVYMHTGVLTTDSQGGTDWKFVKTAWGENLPSVRLQNPGVTAIKQKFTFLLISICPPRCR